MRGLVRGDRGRRWKRRWVLLVVLALVAFFVLVMRDAMAAVAFLIAELVAIAHAAAREEGRIPHRRPIDGVLHRRIDRRA